jgi:hypothetical protein
MNIKSNEKSRIRLLVAFAISAILAVILLPALLHALTGGYASSAKTPATNEVTQPARASAVPAKDVSEKESNSDWDFLNGFVPAYNRVWTSPPLVETSDTVNAPVMGNGNMAVCVSGSNDKQVYYMRTADFWSDENGVRFVAGNIINNSSVREIPSGCLTIGLDGQNSSSGSAEKSVRYRQEEDMLNAEIRSDLPFSNYELKVTSYVTATENTMVVELSSLKPVRVNVGLNTDVYDRVASYSTSAGVDGNVLYLTRETRNTSESRWVSRNAYATRIFGAGQVKLTAVDASHCQATFELPADATVKVVTCLDGGKNATNPLPAAKRRVAAFNERDITILKKAHRNWWKTNWWLKSYVRTYDDTMDKYDVRCLYQLGTMCRAGFVNSGLHGPWKASDTLHNYSSYCMNDIGACSYYLALMSANRASTAKMWIQTIYDWMPEGKRRAVNDAHVSRGVFFPVHWGPWGSTYEDVYWGQKFCATYGSLIGNWYYRDTEDVVCLRQQIYPFMKECANFYEDWLTKEADGKYHVRGASFESGTPADGFNNDHFQNSCEDLFAAKILFTDIVKYSQVLGLDSERRGKWEDIRDHLNDFSTTTENGMTVYKADSSTPFEASTNIIQTEIIYPGYSCNRRSAPEIRQIGYNTILQAAQYGGWTQDNMRGEGLFVAAERIGGFKVEDLITHYKAMLATRPIDFPGYIADAGLWEFNNELCMQCYDHDVMFFPDYPSDRKASFKRLRAPGAFLCSGEFRNGAADDLVVYSEKGNPFTFIGPWGKTVPIEIREVGGNLMPTRKDDDKYTFDTIAGKAYGITRLGTPPHPAQSETE